MASELSRLIEDELKHKGYYVDEEEDVEQPHAVDEHKALIGALRVEARVKEQNAQKHLLGLKRGFCIGGGIAIVITVWIVLVVKSSGTAAPAQVKGSPPLSPGTSSDIGSPPAPQPDTPSEDSQAWSPPPEPPPPSPPPGDQQSNSTVSPSPAPPPAPGSPPPPVPEPPAGTNSTAPPTASESPPPPLPPPASPSPPPPPANTTAPVSQPPPPGPPVPDSSPPPSPPPVPPPPTPVNQTAGSPVLPKTGELSPPLSDSDDKTYDDYTGLKPIEDGTDDGN